MIVVIIWPQCPQTFYIYIKRAVAHLGQSGQLVSGSGLAEMLVRGSTGLEPEPGAKNQDEQHPESRALLSIQRENALHQLEEK